MDKLPVPAVADLASDIEALARRYRRAGGPLVTLMTSLGGQVEQQLGFLPPGFRARAEEVTEGALQRAWGLAGIAPLDRVGRGRRAPLVAAIAAGAVGGAGGLAGSLAELPVTVTLILRAIRDEARAAGLDPDDAEVRGASLAVFAAGSPLAGDDGIDTAFLSARLTLTGPALQGLIGTVAPRLAAVLTQKLAAQAVPILGAVSGAALNAAFLSYYRELAAIRFALLALAARHGEDTVTAAFRAATARPDLRLG